MKNLIHNIIPTLLLIASLANKSYAFELFGCKNLRHNLITCQPYECTEINPLLVLSVNKHKIHGMENNLCKYSQKNIMGNLECNFTPAELTQLKHLRDIFATDFYYHNNKKHQYNFINTDHITANCQIDRPNYLIADISNMNIPIESFTKNDYKKTSDSK